MYVIAEKRESSKRERRRGRRGAQKLERESTGEREGTSISKNQTDLSESTGLTACLPANRYATGWGSLGTVSNLR